MTLTESAHSPVCTVRTALRPGDLGAIVQLHGTVYARECGFDATFEAYVAEPLALFVRGHTQRERLWLAEREGRLAGCIAIVSATQTEAQLRWFLVDPACRGAGLGTALLREALGFAEAQGYRSVFLWTVSRLAAAARLYRSAGFRQVEQKPGAWGVPVTEEKYVLRFGDAEP